MRLLTHWEIWKLRREDRKLNKESERVWAEAIAQKKPLHACTLSRYGLHYPTNGGTDGGVDGRD